ncbi:MAG: hypothetical protein IJC39_04895 [Firmicutes bacterium]|nr:hypothetical protein [Bacillota bacterium]
MIKKIILVCSSLVLLMLFIYPAELIAAAKEALLLWFELLLPSLFPFMAGLGIISGLGGIAALPAAFSSALGSFLGGYPTGAKLLGEARLSGELGGEQAKKLLPLLNNPGAFFLIGTLGTGLFSDDRAGLILLLASVFAAFTVAAVSRPKIAAGENFSRCSCSSSTQRPVFSVIKEAVSSSLYALTQVGGFMILFFVIVRSLELSGLKALTGELPFALISGIFEMTGGVYAVSALAAAPELKLAFAAGLCSFGGLCVCAQSLCMPGVDCSGADYLKTKAAVGVTAAVYAYFMACVLL